MDIDDEVDQQDRAVDDIVPSAYELLPAIALERAIGQRGIERLQGKESVCIVVRVPEGSWVDPMSRCLRKTTAFATGVVAREKPKRRDDDTPATIANCLSGGLKVYGVSPDPRAMLPDVLVSSSDLFVDLPPLDSDIIAATLKRITGRQVKVPAGCADGLTFAEIASCMRRGSTARQCIARIKSIASKGAMKRAPIVGAVPVDELIGYGEAKDWAANLVADIEAWRRGDTDFQAIESRLVVAGPPGTGKTTLAKSVAHSAGIPLIATSAAAWFLNGAGYLDSVIKQIDAVFSEARSLAPALLFIDELDAVPDRSTLSSRGRDWWLPVIVHLLTLLDGANEDNRDLVIMGATNYPDRLDDALTRSGRLSRLIRIEAPNTQEAALILRQHLGSDLSGVDLRNLATMMPGATGADIAETVKRARAKARRRGATMGLDDMMSIMSPPDHRSHDLLQRISTHEAGHAVVAHALGSGRVQAISLHQSGSAGGSAHFEYDEIMPTRQGVEARVIQLLGGRAAELVLLGDIGTGSGGISESDLGRATMLIASLHASHGLGPTLSYRGGQESIERLMQFDHRFAAAIEADLKSLHEQAETLVSENADLVRAVAKDLRETRFLTRESFMQIVDRFGGAKNAR